MSAQRRGKGEGSIRLRSDGRWEARIGYEGRIHSFFGATRKEAFAKLLEYRHAIAEGVEADLGRQRLGAYLHDWLRLTAPTLRVSSAQRYEIAIRRHIEPVIGHVPLVRLRAQDVQALHARLLSQGLSAATIGHVHSVLNAALADAERWGRIGRNPARLVSVPKDQRREMQTFTPSEAITLLTVAETAPLGTLFALLLTTGLRIGEALACRWTDVDLVTGRLAVTGTMSRGEKGYIRTEPKTASGRRLILLSSDGREALKRQAIRQKEQKLAAGRAWGDRGYIFTDAIGRPLNPGGAIDRAWKDLLTTAQLPARRIHDLRHTYATLQLGQNTPAKVVSEALGHSNIAITMNRYSHVTQAMQELARSNMDRALGR
jgi:integrase